MEKTTNELGRMAGGRSAAQSVTPTLATFVRRHLTELVHDVDLQTLRDGVEAIEKERQIEEQHSPPLADAEAHRLADQYGREPTKENLEALRHSRTLEPFDHSLAQQHSRNRREVIVGQLTPLVLPLLRKAGELAEADADGLEQHDAAIYGGWNLSPVTSPLVLGLRELGRGFTGQSKAGRLDGVPELVVEILRSWDLFIAQRAESESAAASPAPGAAGKATAGVSNS